MSDDNSEDSLEYKESHYGYEEVGGEDERHRELQFKHHDEYGFHEGEEGDEEEDEAVEELYYEWRAYGGDEEAPKQKRVKEAPGLRKIDDARADKLTSAIPARSFASLQTLADSETGSAEEREPRFSETLGIPGVARLELSELTQKIIGCVIDENVTTEYPWVYVRKDVLEDNLELHSESSDFLPVKKEIESYNAPEMLVGYAPKVGQNVGQFYICLTEESKRNVEQRIEEIRQEQQERVRNALFKIPRTWQHLGSGDVIDDTIIKKSRPLFEIEVQSSVEQLKAQINLADRNCSDKRDGYVELVPHREVFTNIERVLVDKDAKAIPDIKANNTQTQTTMLINAWSQCALDQETIGDKTYTDKKSLKDLEKFLKSRTEDICKEIYGNTTWDVYADDYAKLRELANEEERSWTSAATCMPEGYVERQIYYEGNLCRGRVINDLSWHPQWTGVVAAVYTPAGKSENLVGRKPLDKESDGENQVLIWSLDDCLKPKLILESKRQVTSISFCPRDGNIIIGGCKNGQIVIWDISGKIEEVEKMIVRTAAQVKHSTVIKSLCKWMKEPRDSSVIRPTATSNLQQSQKNAITKIEWISPYHKIDNRGALHDLPADTTEKDLSNIFVTSSEDGSIAFWDLNLEPYKEMKKEEKAKSKKRKSAFKPQALKESISNYKILDGTYKPIYMVIVSNASTGRNVVVTAMSIRYPNLKKVQIDPIPRSNDTCERKYYKTLIEKDEERQPIAEIFIGTASGECGVVSWEGFNFSTGVAVNKEVGKWTWKKQVHDGPVSHAVRSRHLKDLLLTVGGRIFAVWREDFGEPILWRKSEFRYTACSWDGNKPTVMILGRNDGTVEIWDIFIKSHEPNITQSLSGRIITGIYAHELPLNPQCVGFCDYNGALRIFLASKVSFEFRQSDVEWMRQFVTREINRITDFKEWSKKWIELTAIHTDEQEKDRGEDVKKLIATEDKQRDELAKEAANLEAARKIKAKRRKQLIEEMRERWVTRELNRMERAILTKKGLKEEELERRREPMLRMKREAEEKEARRRRVIESAPELFEEAVASNFPHQREKLLTAFTRRRTVERADSLVDPRATGDYKTPEDEIIEEYESIEAQALEQLQNRSCSADLEFSWRRLIEEGLRRRKSLDINLKSHKIKVQESLTSASAVGSLFSDREDFEDANSKRDESKDSNQRDD